MRTIPIALLLPALCLPACGNEDDTGVDTNDSDATDLDGDGVAAPEDCDDADATVFPGATEVKGDGKDNDCDTLTDCDDDDLTTTIVADVGEADVPTLCDAWCALTVEGDILLQGTALTDLDALSCVTAVDGDVRIEENPTLASVAGLGNLRVVTGALVVGEGACDGPTFERPTCSGTGNPALTSLAGFESLERVGTFLSIAGNDALVDPGQGFPALTQVGGGDMELNWGVLLVHNPALSALPAFPVLTNAGEFVSIYDHASLTSLAGLEVLGTGEEAYLFLTIAMCPGLTDLTGLSGLGAFPGSLGVLFNDGLTSMAGVEGLTSLDFSLEVWGNPALTSLDGLGGLTSIGQWLQMNNNDALVSLEGLGALEHVEIDFNVFDNDALISLYGVEAMRTIGGNLQIGPLTEDVGNDALADLDGLHGLTSVGGDVNLTCDPHLTPVEVGDLIEAIDTIGGTVNLTCD